MFTARRQTRAQRRRRERGEEVFGELVLAGDTLLGEVGVLYGFPVDDKDRNDPVGAYVRRRLRHRPVVGDRLRVGPIELGCAKSATTASPRSASSWNRKIIRSCGASAGPSASLRIGRTDKKKDARRKRSRSERQ